MILELLENQTKLSKAISFRYLMLGDVSVKAAHMLSQPKVKIFKANKKLILQHISFFALPSYILCHVLLLNVITLDISWNYIRLSGVRLLH